MIELLEHRIAPAALLFAQHSASALNTGAPEAVDADGDVFVAGSFDGKITLGKGPSAVHLHTAEKVGGHYVGSNAYIAEYSPTGKLLWAQTWGGVADSNHPRDSVHVSDLELDPTGSFLYVAGGFSAAQAGFGGSGESTSAGGTDAFVLKLSAATGAPVSSFGHAGAVTWGGSLNDSAASLAFTSSGAVAVAGSYASANATFTSTAGPSAPAPVGAADAFIFEVAPATGAPNATFAGSGLFHTGMQGAATTSLQLVDNNSLASLYLLAAQGQNRFLLAVDEVNGTLHSGFGGTGRLDTPSANALALDASGNLLVTGSLKHTHAYAERFLASTGRLDAAFHNGAPLLLPGRAASGLSVAPAPDGSLFVAGTTAHSSQQVAPYFLAHITAGGTVDPLFAKHGIETLAQTGIAGRQAISVAVSASGPIVLRGFFSGRTDLDPTRGVHGASSSAPSPGAGHASLDSFTSSIDPNLFNAANPFTRHDADGNLVTVAVSGPGSFDASLLGGAADGAGIANIELEGTTLATVLTIGVASSDSARPPTTTIDRIATADPNQSIGAIHLEKGVILGAGSRDRLPALFVSGKVLNLDLYDINANAVIELGRGLPLTAEGSTPSAANNAPNLTIHDVLGPGLLINLDSVTLQGVQQGGGGLGHVSFTHWDYPGAIATSGSVDSFSVNRGDFVGDLFIGEPVSTLSPHARAHFDSSVDTGSGGIGKIDIPNGNWGSTGTEIQGNVGSFDAAGFLAGAQLTAAGIAKFLVTSGPYAGTTTLTDPNGAKLATFTVNSDYQGYVISQNSIINVKVNGQFKGGLQAASIGSITAYNFDGSTTTDTSGDDPNRFDIIAANGSLGTLKATAGGVDNYEITAATIFNGFNVTDTSAVVATVGLGNVTVNASQINNTAVTLGTHNGSALVGIQNTIFNSLTGIGTITSTHSVTGSVFAAGGSLGAVMIGNSAHTTSTLTGSSLLAGVYLGDDFAIGGADDIYSRAGQIASVTVKGAVTQSVIAAGVMPINGVFGDGNDVASPGTLGSGKAIGALTFGGSSGTLKSSPLLSHTFAIEGASIKSLKIGSAAAVTSFTSARFIQVGSAEASTDLLVKLI